MIRPAGAHRERVVELYAYGAFAGALGSGSLRAYWAFDRESGLPGDGPLGIAAGWGAVTLCLVAAAVALATIAPWGRAIPRRPLLALAWSTCALLLATAAVGLPGDVGAMLAGDEVNWPGFGNRVLCLAGGVLWFATARAYQATAARCGSG